MATIEQAFKDIQKDFVKFTGDNLVGSIASLDPALQTVEARANAVRNFYKKEGRLPSVAFLPSYVTGARAVVYVNQKKVAACLDVAWSISVETQEIRTIDSQMPWELVPGQIKVNASLRRLIHPDRTAAGDHLFTIITAALHTPTATIEIRDRLGNPLFIAKGSFTDLEGSVSTGKIGIESVKFSGYYWRQNDQQAFEPEIRNLGPLDAAAQLGRAKLGAITGLASQVGLLG
jgi:hypothetical protein